jgi:hypothetical protein
MIKITSFIVVSASSAPDIAIYASGFEIGKQIPSKQLPPCSVATKDAASISRGLNCLSVFAPMN